MPDSWTWVSHFVTHEPDAIVSWVRLDLIYYGAGRGPCHDGRLHSHRGASGGKCEVARAAADQELAIGNVVIHVALVRMRLAPGVFARGDVLRFGEIGRARILRWVQVAHRHCYPV